MKIERRRKYWVDEELRVEAHNHTTGETIEGPQDAVLKYVAQWTCDGHTVIVSPPIDKLRGPPQDLLEMFQHKITDPGSQHGNTDPGSSHHLPANFRTTDTRPTVGEVFGCSENPCRFHGNITRRM